LFTEGKLSQNGKKKKVFAFFLDRAAADDADDAAIIARLLI
jgi:hypothetical protein